MRQRGWQQYEAPTVAGDVRILRGVASPQLGNERDLLVYLPPSYRRRRRRYPVLYMHDGQNLFDEATSFAGEWRVDETMEALAEEGLEAIVVGVPNAGDRVQEYSPVGRPEGGGDRGELYVRFLVETVKPLVDRSLRTQTARAATGLFGSSLGGLISLYALFSYPQVYGFVGAMSPSVGWAQGSIFTVIEAAPPVDARIYLDAGGREHAGSRSRSRAYVRELERLVELLRSKGYGEERLRHVVEPEARHDESAWARRLPAALRFLLPRR